ncbi:amidohydrolase [Marinobacter adhaerens]|uniref:Amidohydrolase n=1 Tax=Marinobacter adhaerens TaxID=1033846 RepID=A0A851HYX0_9GAMM|nr:amidohydrolase [Marinobacter adhaerens]NWN92462.1 amidohydrolase [Marinobacter adhaerens]
MKSFIPCLIPLAMIVAGCQSTPPAEMADAIWFNGSVITIDDDQPKAEAVATRNGRIVAVGNEDDILRYQGDRTIMNDLEGNSMLPGFVDSHGHVTFVGFQALSANLLPPPDGRVSNVDGMVRTLTEFARDSSLKTDFGTIYGFGYDDSQLAERRHPNRQELDRVSEELPVFIIHQSAHFGVLNSAALAKAGITADSANPPGGVIVKDPETGEPTGLLEENAFFMALGKLFPQMSPQQAVAMLKQGEQLYTSYGYTTIQDGRSSPQHVKLGMGAAKAGVLEADIVSYPDILNDGVEELMVPPFYTNTTQTPRYRNHFRIGGIKLTLDGSPQGKTAWLTKPYYEPPHGKTDAYSGYGVVENDKVIEVYTKALENHWQTLTHANGDRAIDQMLMGWKKAEQAVTEAETSDIRPVMIHGQTLRKDQVAQLDELDVIPSLFPMHTFYWGDWHRQTVLGPDRAENISPTGWVREQGMRFTSHHDAPVVLPNSMRVLDATVNRTTRSGRVLGEEQKVDVMTALKAMTLWSAWQHFEEDQKGSIEVGKLADFVVLSDNPLLVDSNSLINLRILETIKEGNSIYKASGDAAAHRPPALGLAPVLAAHDHKPGHHGGDGCFGPALDVIFGALSGQSYQ